MTPSAPRGLSPRFAMVVTMPDMDNDPSGNTAQFQAFAATPTPEAPRRSPVGLIVAGVAAVAVVAVIVWAVL